MSSLSDTSPQKSPPDAASDASFRLQGRVLVAEDYPPNQMVAEFFLGKLGLEVDVAVDGREALAALSVGQYDVVLLDVVMPEVDGLEVARRVRAGRVPGCPTDLCLIATTTHSGEKEREVCFAAGMTEFLVKPFDLEQLAGYIRPWVDELPKEVAGQTPVPAPPVEASEGRDMIFDFPRLLMSLRQNQPLFANYVSGFLDHSTAEMEKIRTALADGNCLTVRHVLHNWTGACGYLRAQPLLAAIQAMAPAARAGDIEGARAAWPKVEKQMFLLHGALLQARLMM